MRPSKLKIHSDPRIPDIPLPSFLIPFTTTGCIPHLTPDILSKTLGPTDFAGFECFLESFLVEKSSILSTKLKAIFSLNPHPIFLSLMDQEYCGFSKFGGRCPSLRSDSHTLNKMDRGISISNKEGISFFKQKIQLPLALKSLSPNFWISPLDSYPPLMAERRKRVIRASKMTMELFEEAKHIIDVHNDGNTGNHNDCKLIPSIHIPSSEEMGDILKEDLLKGLGEEIICVVGDPKNITSNLVDQEKITIYRGKSLSPEEMIEMIPKGFDLFSADSIIRDAENGKALLIDDKLNIKRLDLNEKEYFNVMEPLDKNCLCIACKGSKTTISYIHHLLKTKEMLSHILLTSHNLRQMVVMFERIRQNK